MSVLEDVTDAFRQLIPYYFVLIVPLLILISPIDPVKAAQQFTAFRLQQYDIQGVKIGSRSSAFNYEAQTSHSKSLGRKCLLLKLMEVSAASIKLAISQNVGSIVILLPLKSQWDGPIREHIMILEKELLLEDFAIPIYFSFETAEVSSIYDSVHQLMESGKSSSAAQALLNSVTSNAYQLYTSSVAAALNRGGFQQPSEYQITNFYGKLPGNGIEEQLPTVLIVTHYDAMGMVPSLSYGYDSNASGVAMMLQLMRLFSRLYAIPKSQPKFNLAFLLTGGGKLNYIGTKRWLEELHELQDGSLSPERVSLAICLERVGLADDGLFLHVSKPPKAGSSGERLASGIRRAMRAWTSANDSLHSDSDGNKRVRNNATVVHQRINLNEDELHWEHERFSLRKMTAVTVSAERDHLHNRRSMLDDHVSIPLLARNTRVVADALMGLLYGLNGGGGSNSNSNSEGGNSADETGQSASGTGNAADDDGGHQDEPAADEGQGASGAAEALLERDWISEEAIATDIALLTREPRGQQLLEQGATGTFAAARRAGAHTSGGSQQQHPLVASIAALFKRYTGARATTSRVRADPREPEFVLFGDAEMLITAHRVKPALFDLLVSSVIALYLGLVFLFVEHFSWLSRLLLRVAPAKNQHQSHKEKS